MPTKNQYFFTNFVVASWFILVRNDLPNPISLTVIENAIEWVLKFDPMVSDMFFEKAEELLHVAFARWYTLYTTYSVISGIQRISVVYNVYQCAREACTPAYRLVAACALKGNATCINRREDKLNIKWSIFKNRGYWRWLDFWKSVW